MTHLELDAPSAAYVIKVYDGPYYVREGVYDPDVSKARRFSDLGEAIAVSESLPKDTFVKEIPA